MLGLINGIDFSELENQKYWAPPASWTDEKKKQTIRSRIFSNEWLGAEKKDGYFCRIIKNDDGTILLQSRTRGVNGQYPEKHEWVPHLQPFFDWLPNGTCLLGELYLPSSPGSSNITKILGCLKEKAIARQEKEKLHLYIFDILAYNGESFLEKTFEQRKNSLEVLRATVKNQWEELEIAIYYNGIELWNELERILENDGEGIVITRKDSRYQPGKRPSKDCQKVKKEIANTIDCFFTGKGTEPTKEYTGKELETWPYYINTITDERLEIKEHYREYMTGSPIIPVTKPYYYGWAGSLEIGVVKGDKVIPIGLLSGLSDDLKSQPAAQKGKVIEVSCMEIQYHDDGRLPGLRHAKMIQFRPDKNWKECKWEDIFGKEK